MLHAGVPVIADTMKRQRILLQLAATFISTPGCLSWLKAPSLPPPAPVFPGEEIFHQRGHLPPALFGFEKHE